MGASEKSLTSAKSVPVDWNALFSEEGRARKTGELSRLLFQFAGVKGVAPLHPGLPPADSFPVESLTVRLTDGMTITVDEPAKVVAAQQYNTHQQGYPALQQWAERHVRQMHNPSAEAGHEVLITEGNSHAMTVAFQLLLERGDPLLCEEYTYTHALESVSHPRGYQPVGIEMDREGLIPSSLAQVLDNWTEAQGKRPKLLYTVPVGHNPTGIITPLHRKQAIYRLCQQHGVIIVEDDPYWYLQLAAEQGEQPGIRGLGSSYLSLDMDGRVIRLDSFAKFLGPGFRCGWVTAAPAMLAKMQMQLFANTLGASGVTQVLLAEMLERWGEEGLHRQVQRVQALYSRRAATLHRAACTHLAGLAEWQPPHSGMFMWVKLLCGIEESSDIMEKLRDAKVVVVPGRICHWQGSSPNFTSPFIRVSFVFADEADLELGMERLGSVLRGIKASSAHKR